MRYTFNIKVKFCIQFDKNVKMLFVCDLSLFFFNNRFADVIYGNICFRFFSCVAKSQQQISIFFVYVNRVYVQTVYSVKY